MYFRLYILKYNFKKVKMNFQIILKLQLNSVGAECKTPNYIGRRVILQSTQGVCLMQNSKL